MNNSNVKSGKSLKIGRKGAIDVNEQLNVSIGSLMGTETEKQTNDICVNDECAKESGAKENKKDVNKANKVNKNVISNDNKPNQCDIKSIVPKLGKVALHRQRAGRGGRTVTVVTISGDVKPDPEALLKEMKKSLGCGGQVEDGKAVLHGDIAERAADWFTKHGAKKCVMP